MSIHSPYAQDIVKPHLERLLESRSFPKTICPSEVPRALSKSELTSTGASSWRDLMPLVRKMLWEMREAGEVEILQKGNPLPNTTALDEVVGPIRARKRNEPKA